MPVLFKEVHSVFDAIITINTLKQQIQNATAEKATKMKVSEYEKEFRLKNTSDHAKRYEELLKLFMDDPIEDVSAILAKVIEKINLALQKENQDRKLEDLLK